MTQQVLYPYELEQQKQGLAEFTDTSKSLNGTTNANNNNNATNAREANLTRVEILRMEIQDGFYAGTRDFFVALRFDNEQRSACMDGLAQGYHHGQNVNGNASSALLTLEKWTREEPDNKDAHLILGSVRITTAWAALRDPANASVPEEQLFQAFTNQLEQAEASLQVAIDLDPNDPLPYAQMLTATRKLSKLRAVFDKFKQNCKDPYNLMVHEVMLHRLAPHWGGSVEEVLQFARTSTTLASADNFPPLGHPVWGLLAKAHLLIWEEQKKDPQMDAALYWKDMAIRKEIVKTYRKYRKTTYKEETPETRDACTNLFAFILYKCKAFTEAYTEFQAIGDMTHTPSPWNKEHETRWKSVYQKAQRKVVSRVKAKKDGSPSRSNDNNGSTEFSLGEHSTHTSYSMDSSWHTQATMGHSTHGSHGGGAGHRRQRSGDAGPKTSRGRSGSPGTRNERDRSRSKVRDLGDSLHARGGSKKPMKHGGTDRNGMGSSSHHSHHSIGRSHSRSKGRSS